MKRDRKTFFPFKIAAAFLACTALACGVPVNMAFAQAAQSTTTSGPVRITLDDAIRLAIQHNHNLRAQQTTIQQSQAEEITQGLRPNPTLFADWDYLPFTSPATQNPDLYAGQSTADYLRNNTEGDVGLSYLIERGGKRLDRLQAQKDVTTQTRSLVADDERSLTYQVAQDFINVQLAESTIDLAQQDLKSFQQTVDIGAEQYKVGAIAETDYLQIQLQLLQFESDLEQAQLARTQGLSDLRQQLGYESVSADYDVAEMFDYVPVKGTLEDFQMMALQARPDLRAAQQGVTAANSQYVLQKAIGKQDVTVQANYSHVNGINGFSLLGSIPLAIHNRNQGEIERTRFAITMTQEQEQYTDGQVLTDVKDGYEGLKSNERLYLLYRDKYHDIATRNRDIADYTYHRGGISLLEFLDAERGYRGEELGFRQALASYLLAVEQLRDAVGTRNLP